MRRNSTGKRGGVNVSGGPLITEHLKDIDLELELLKRKREMIEQHHFYSMSTYQPQGQYSGHESANSYNQPNLSSDRNYSHLYDDAPNFGGQHGRKRRDPWDQDGANAHPNKKRPIQAIFGSRLGPKPVSSGPSNAGPARHHGQNPKQFHASPTPLMTLMTLTSQKFNKRALLKNPMSGKVSKPKPATAPNKLASKPVAERAKLVAETTSSLANVNQSMILRKDCPPSPQMSGRFELTLGTILKDIKLRYSKTPMYVPLFNSVHTLRVMKQAVRERIKVAMLNKVVGTTSEIQQHYRAEYPEETDVDIVNMAMEAAGISPAVVHVNKEATSYHEVFRVNMNNLIDERLDALFKKMREQKAKERQDNTATVAEVLDDKNDGSVDEPGRNVGTVMVRKFLPRIMKKYAGTLAELIDAEEIHQLVKESLDAIKAGKAAKGEGPCDAPVKMEGNQKDVVAPPQQSSLVALPYFVKIRAKPTLPSKKIMREFLESFNPKMIKKHKSIHNLLFVGFSEKENYDSMLAVNGTAIGRIVLEITPSEKAAPKPKNDEDNDSLNTSLDKLISPELDGQITDLLMSIRKTDEEGKGKDSLKMDTSDDNQIGDALNDEKATEIKKEITDTTQKVEAKNEEDTKTSLKTEVSAVKTIESQNPEKLVASPEQVSEMQVTDATQEAAVTPVTGGEATERISETPVTVARTQTANPAKVAETHGKVAATPSKVATTPTKVAENPAKVEATPAKIAATPTKVAATPATVAATPAKVAATPAKVAATPAKVAAIPAKVAATPVKIAATPATVAATPDKVAATPAKVAATPAKVAATPAKVAATPAKVADNPAKLADNPAKVAATPAAVADTPAKVAAAPAKVAATPAKVAENPAVAATPATVAETPAKVASTPAKKSVAPAQIAETPAKVAATSAKVAATPAKVATTPAKVAATPAKVAETPVEVAATPAKVTATPAKVAEIPAKVAETPAKVADTPVKVAETPAEVPATPAKVAEVPNKATEQPKREAKEKPDNPEEDGETKDKVAELKSAQKESGRSTPTRMTRSANVTPSTIRTRRASRLAQNQ